MQDEDAHASEGAEAEAGAGAPPEPRPSPAPKNSNGRRSSSLRGKTSLTPELRELAHLSGEVKLAPDTTAVERHYARSLRIREYILEFLKENAGSTWSDPRELYARAANFCNPICSTTTAERWIHQFTRVGAPFKIVEGLGYVILERREGT
jgi:hypothetical protein